MTDRVQGPEKYGKGGGPRKDKEMKGAILGSPRFRKQGERKFWVPDLRKFFHSPKRKTAEQKKRNSAI